MTHPQSCQNGGKWRSHGDPEDLGVEIVQERERSRFYTEADQFKKNISRDRRGDHFFLNLFLDVEEDVI